MVYNPHRYRFTTTDHNSNLTPSTVGGGAANGPGGEDNNGDDETVMGLDFAAMWVWGSGRGKLGLFF